MTLVELHKQLTNTFTEEQWILFRKFMVRFLNR